MFEIVRRIEAFPEALVHRVGTEREGFGLKAQQTHTGQEDEE